MIKSLIDSGPLYALYDKSDSYHEQIVDFMRSYKGFLYTSDFVIAEVSHLLRRSVRAQIVFWEFISAGGLHVLDFKKEYYIRILELAKKYRDLPTKCIFSNFIQFYKLYNNIIIKYLIIIK